MSETYYLFQRQRTSGGLVKQFTNAIALRNWLDDKLNDPGSGLDIDEITIICGRQVSVETKRVLKSVRLDIPQLGTEKTILVKDV